MTGSVSISLDVSFSTMINLLCNVKGLQGLMKGINGNGKIKMCSFENVPKTSQKAALHIKKTICYTLFSGRHADCTAIQRTRWSVLQYVEYKALAQHNRWNVSKQNLFTISIYMQFTCSCRLCYNSHFILITVTRATWTMCLSCMSHVQ